MCATRPRPAAATSAPASRPGPDAPAPGPTPEAPASRLAGADLALLAVAAIWGASFAVIKAAYREVPALPFLGMRFLLAALGMLPFLLWQRRLLPRSRQAWLGALVIGALGVAGYQLLFSLGLQHTSASKSTLLVATSPLWTALFARLLGTGRAGRAQWVGMAAALAGVALLTLGDGGGPRGPALLGDVLTLGAGAAAGASVALSERYVRGADGTVLTGVALLLGSVGVQLLAGPATLAFPWASVSAGAWLALVYAALLAGSLGYAVWYRNISRLGAVRGSLYGFLIPVFGVLSAVAALGETMTAAQGAGALLVLLGVAAARGWLRPRRAG